MGKCQVYALNAKFNNVAYILDICPVDSYLHIG